MLNSKSDEFFAYRAFNVKNTIADIENYVNASFAINQEKGTEKVFYHIEEWSGWRFWLKAIKNKDFASMKSHLGY